MATTLTINGDKIVETRTEVIEHNPVNLLENLETQKANLISGRDTYLTEVNGSISAIETKIQTIQNLLA